MYASGVLLVMQARLRALYGGVLFISVGEALPGAHSTAVERLTRWRPLRYMCAQLYGRRHMPDGSFRPLHPSCCPVC